MSDTQFKIGKLLDPLDKDRDAIHIAVYPVVANEQLRAGDHIGFAIEGNMSLVSKTPAKDFLGVVDPFLQDIVYGGDHFYMFLYPNTIKSLRHEWTHDYFQATEPNNRSEDVEWISELAQELGYTYDALMDIASSFNKWEDYHMDNRETYKNINSNRWEEFWTRYQRITGEELSKDVQEWHSAPFTCSC